MNPEEISREYDASIQEASRFYADVQNRLNNAIAQLDALPTATTPEDPYAPGASGGSPDREALQKKIADLQKQYADAADRYGTLLQARADAMLKARSVTPQQKAALDAQVQADRAKAEAVALEANEFVDTAPERKEENTLKTAVAKSNADVAAAKARVASATTQAEIDAAHANLRTAQANATNAENNARAAGISLEFLPRQESAQTTVLEGQAAVSQAEGGVAGQKAQLSVDDAQARVDQARTAAEDARRRLRQAPTDEQAQRVIQQELARTELDLQTAQLALDQAKALAGTQVKQAGANLAATEAGTDATRANAEQGRLGPVYGLDEQVQKIRALLASGQLGSGPEAQQRANELLNQYTQATIRGTTIYDAQRQREQDQQARLQQRINQRESDSGFEQARMGNFGNLFQSGFGQIATMNAAATPGSTGGADAFLALLGLAQQQLGTFQPPSRVAVPDAPNYLGGAPIANLIGAAQQQLTPQPPTPAAAPAPAAGSPVSITINSAPQAQPSGISGWGQGAAFPSAQPVTPPASVGQQAAASMAGAIDAVPAAVRQLLPATEDDVKQIWGRSTA